MMTQHGFLGVPVETFEQGGRGRLIALLNEGMTAESKVLDIGCGCLRVAYWLIRFLDPGCYFGIEPASVRVDYGLHYLFTPEEIELKHPRFDFNTDFDSSSTGIFLASYLPAQSSNDDYQGDRWVGTSHESAVPGVIRHSLEWILRQCEARGLEAREMPGIDCDGQFWLRINYRADGGVDQ